MYSWWLKLTSEHVSNQVIAATLKGLISACLMGSLQLHLPELKVKNMDAIFTTFCIELPLLSAQSLISLSCSSLLMVGKLSLALLKKPQKSVEWRSWNGLHLPFQHFSFSHCNTKSICGWNVFPCILIKKCLSCRFWWKSKWTFVYRKSLQNVQVTVCSCHALSEISLHTRLKVSLTYNKTSGVRTIAGDINKTHFHSNAVLEIKT